MKISNFKIIHDNFPCIATIQVTKRFLWMENKSTKVIMRNSGENWWFAENGKVVQGLNVFGDIDDSHNQLSL